MKTKPVLLAIVALAAALPAFAKTTNWEFVTKTPDGTVYIDPASVYKGPRTSSLMPKTVRTLISYNSEQTSFKGKKFFSMEFIDEMNCTYLNHTTLSSVMYAGKIGTGAVVTAHKMTARIQQRIEPGTNNQMILASANCNLHTGAWGG